MTTIPDFVLKTWYVIFTGHCTNKFRSVRFFKTEHLQIKEEEKEEEGEGEKKIEIEETRYFVNFDHFS